MWMKSDFDEFLNDAELGIKTIGRIDKHSDKSYFPYEPTTYAVLKRIAESEYLSGADCVLDYGCGKGRVPIYLHDTVGCRTIGVEVEKSFYEDALGNLNSYKEKSEKETDGISLVRSKAQDFEVPEEVTACFFFNPFSSDILKNVMVKILESVRKNPRSMFLFFFYPSDAYVALLSKIDEVMFVDEIDCTDIFPTENDPRNRVMIYEINA